MKAFETCARAGRRASVLLLAALQLGMSVALPGMDGVLDVERLLEVDHVESGERDACAHRHDHAFCQVVRAVSLATPARGSAESRLARPAPVLHAAPPRAPLLSAAVLLRGAPGPRAPPSFA